jgi:type I restriction enzyme M protein
MADYLDQIAAAKADVARLKGEKEAFEQSNEPDDADEEEIKNWNYAKDLERQIRELKAENKDALKELARLEKAAAKAPSAKRKPSPLAGGGTGEGVCLQTARDSLQPVLDQVAALESALAPYEQIKRDLSAARTCFRKLTDEFVSELKNRCGFMGDDKKRALVLELLAQEVQGGLNDAISEKRQALVGLVDALWEKYGVPFTELQNRRGENAYLLSAIMKDLRYA